eukprot:366341-Chlamydomonas_euryale.AAC.32
MGEGRRSRDGRGMKESGWAKDEGVGMGEGRRSRDGRGMKASRADSPEWMDGKGRRSGGRFVCSLCGMCQPVRASRAAFCDPQCRSMICASDITLHGWMGRHGDGGGS